MNNRTLEYSDRGHARIYRVTDDLLFQKSKRFEMDVINTAKNIGRDIVFDLNDIAKIDSTALAMIIRISRDVSEHGKDLTIVNANDAIAAIFDISGMDDLLA